MTRAQAGRRAADRGDRRARSRGAAMAAVPDLGEAAWAAAIASVESPRGIALRDLDEHLASHPDALTSGDPRCPLALVQFTRALNAAGQPAVVSPGCHLCGRDTVELPFSGPAGRSCRRCYISMNKKPCARCGQAGKIVARRGEGGICQSCYRTDPQVTEECAGCGRARRPAVRRPDGTALCESCWRPPVRTCSSCGAERPASLGADGAYCNTCYRRLRQPRRAAAGAGWYGPSRPGPPPAALGSATTATDCSRPPPAPSAERQGPATSTPFTASSAGRAGRTTRNPAPAAASSGASMPAGPGARSVPPATCRSWTIPDTVPSAARPGC